MLHEALPDDGDKGYVTLRGFDTQSGRPTVRTGECVVCHGGIAEPIIAVPAQLGTVDGRWSSIAAVTVMGEPVCFQRVQAAAITTTVENPSDVATFGTRPKYLDLRQAEFSKAEVQSSDVEKKVSSPMKSGVSHSWQAAENLLKSSSGFKLHQLNAERESEEDDYEEDAEEDESQVDPLEK
jgi:hypothetical protein